MPGSLTVMRCRCATFAAVMPVASLVEELRWGFRPNSVQFCRRGEAASAA